MNSEPTQGTWGRRSKARFEGISCIKPHRRSFLLSAFIFNCRLFSFVIFAMDWRHIRRGLCPTVSFVYFVRLLFSGRFTSVPGRARGMSGGKNGQAGNFGIMISQLRRRADYPIKAVTIGQLAAKLCRSSRWDKRPPLEPSFKLTDFIATPRVKFLPLLKSVEVEQQLVSKFWTLTCKVAAWCWWTKLRC